MSGVGTQKTAQLCLSFSSSVTISWPFLQNSISVSLEKWSVVQNATKSLSWFFFFFFTTLMTILFLEKKKKKTDEYLFKLTLFSVPSLPTALVSEFPEVFLIRLFLLLETTLKAFILVSYCFGCWRKIVINSWQNVYAIFTIIL